MVSMPLCLISTPCLSREQFFSGKKKGQNQVFAVTVHNHANSTSDICELSYSIPCSITVSHSSPAHHRPICLSPPTPCSCFDCDGESCTNYVECSPPPVSLVSLYFVWKLPGVLCHELACFLNLVSPCASTLRLSCIVWDARCAGQFVSINYI